MPSRSLLLASTSSARRALMDSLKIPYRAVSPGVTEEVAEGIPVREAVVQLAERKARAVFEREPDALVLGADQLLDFEGRAVGKPETRDAARGQLRALSGKDHDIVTGVCLMGPDFIARHVELTRMRLYPLSEQEIEAYLDTGEWEGCAGGYRVEARGQALFSAIDGDRTNVQGLPMLTVVRLFREAGIKLLG